MSVFGWAWNAATSPAPSSAAQLEQRIVDEAAEAEAKIVEAGGQPKSEEENAAAAEGAHEAIESAKRKRREHMMAVTVEHNNDLYTLLVDSVGDVIPLVEEIL